MKRHRFRSWLGRRLLDRVRWRDGLVHVAYHPDSASLGGLHPEFARTYDAWIAGNRRNNAGDLARLYAFILNIKQTIADGVPGEFAELGVWKGNSAAVLAEFATQDNRQLHLFDTFTGFDERDLKAIDSARAPQFSDASLDAIRKVVGANDRTSYHQGYFPDSITPVVENLEYAFVSIDCDLYAPMKAGLEFFYPRMPRGGTLFLHDYSSGVWPGATQAIDEFRAVTKELLVLLPDKSGTAVIRKSQE